MHIKRLTRLKKQTKRSLKKTLKKLKLNRNFIKNFLAKPIAYLSLILTSAYGVRVLLRSVEESAAFIITAVFVLALTYIISD